MPFAPMSPKDKENENQGAQGGQNVSGTSTSFASNVPGQEGAGQTKDKKSSGQYANIQSYLDANKDQADAMGSKIAQDVETKGAQAKSAVEGFSTKAPEVKAYDPNAALGRATELSDQEKQEYKTQRTTGGYSGPQYVNELEGYQDVSAKSQEAAQMAKDAASETGQQNLLKKTYERPSYTAGQNKLDQVLLQNSAGSKQALQQAASKYADLDKLFSDTSTQVGGKLNQASAQALANKEAIAKAEKEAREGLLNPIQQRAAEQNAANQALIARAQQDFTDETIAGDLLAQLGLQEGQSIYDLNLGNYLKTDATQVGLDQAANAQERQKYAALASLFEDPTMNQITQTGKGVNALGFDTERFAADQASKQSQYQNAYNTAQIEAGGVTATPAQIEKSIADYRAKLNSPEASYRFGGPGGRTYGEMWAESANQMEQKLNEFKNQFGANRKVQRG